MSLIMRAGIGGFKFVLKAIYCIFKLFPVKQNRVLFCSRQSNEVSLDFRLIQEELERRDDSLQFVAVCRFIEKNMASYVAYFFALLKSMFYLATSRVCVIDSYWPAVSLLHHREELTVIQIWHAIGKIKRSGHATVGAVSGRSRNTAKLLNMHENYDYIIAGAEIWNDYYCESFGVSEELLLNYGLPRIDYMIERESYNREKFFTENPELKGKTVILYAPTFRRNMDLKWQEIINKVDSDKYAIIVRNHPIQRIYSDTLDNTAYYFDDWSTMDLIAVCDYVITDYSAIALEAAVLNRRTYYWTYDYEEYLEKNGLNIELDKVAPGHVFKNLDQLFAHMDGGLYDQQVLDDYRKTYLPDELGQSTNKICDLIIKSMKQGKRTEQ